MLYLFLNSFSAFMLINHANLFIDCTRIQNEFFFTLNEHVVVYFYLLFALPWSNRKRRAKSDDKWCLYQVFSVTTVLHQHIYVHKSTCICIYTYNTYRHRWWTLSLSLIHSLSPFLLCCFVCLFVRLRSSLHLSYPSYSVYFTHSSLLHIHLHTQA